MAPFKDMRFNNLLPDWMTSECLSLMRQRDILDAKNRKKPSPFNKLNANIFWNLVNNMKTNLEHQYYVNAISDAKGDSRRLESISQC